jgi:7-cyano-7-deazaguanine synthase
MRTAVLLSGGMDSIALAYWRRPEVAITIDYGQRPAAAETRASTAVTEALGLEHHIVHADLSTLGSGDMAGSEPLASAPVSEWWPFRNQMLITVAAMRGVSIGVKRLLIGTLRTDEVHADGRPAFIEAIGAVLELQEGGMTVEAPAIALSAVELVRMSGTPLELLAWAHSCHVADYACGLCRGCRKHYETLAQLGVDPY